MEIVFFGTPQFASEFLAALDADQNIDVLAVVTQADKPSGRKKVLTASPTKEYATDHQIPVFQPTNLKDQKFLSSLKDLKPDLFVIVAYGKIVPDEILKIPKLGCVNVHPSKLPKYRGPSPMQAVIAAGDKETAVSIMLIDEKMDHGPLLGQGLLTVDNRETVETLTRKVVKIGAPLLIKMIKKFIAGEIEPQEQNHDKATICKLLTKEDGKIDWTQPAEVIERRLRAFTPWPGVWTTWSGKTLKIHSVRLTDDNLITPGQVSMVAGRFLIGTGSNPIEIIELQLEGKQKTTAKVFINGYKQINGQKLG